MATTITHTLSIPYAGVMVDFRLVNFNYSSRVMITWDQEYPHCDKLIVTTDVIMLVPSALAYHLGMGSKFDPIELIKKCPEANPIIEQAMVKLRLVNSAPTAVCSTYRKGWVDFLSLRHRADQNAMWVGKTYHTQYATYCSMNLDIRPYSEDRIGHSITQRMWIEIKEIEKGE